MHSTGSVPAGYKKTEVGVIPEDWDIFALSYVSDVRDGTHDSPVQIESGVPFVTSKNIVDGKLDLTDITYISKTDAELVNKRSKVDYLDILLSMIGTVGNAAIVEIEPTFCIKNVALIKPDHGKVFSNYLLQLFGSKSYSKYIENKLDGGIQKFISLGILRDLLVPLPPSLAEQQAIAEALSDADAYIESLERLIEKKRAIKQGAMQELLTGKRRLPGFAGEWETKRLIEIAELNKQQFDDGDWIEAEHITDSGVRLIQTGNIGIGEFVDKEVKKYIFEDSFHKLKCKELLSGDVLICRLAEPAGRACVLPDLGEGKVVTSVDVTIFRPSPKMAQGQYLVYYFSTGDWLNEVLDQVGGSTHKRISKSALGKMTVPLPSLEEQTAISVILTGMDSEIGVLESKLYSVRQLKQAMMQELLTGRIRLV